MKLLISKKKNQNNKSLCEVSKFNFIWQKSLYVEQYNKSMDSMSRTADSRVIKRTLNYDWFIFETLKGKTTRVYSYKKCQYEIAKMIFGIFLLVLLQIGAGVDYFGVGKYH